MADHVIHIVAEAMLTAAKLAGPILIATLVIGLTLSVLQSATQIQESTLTFVPKLAVAALVLVITGAWSLRVLVGFTREIFAMVPQMVAS